jgi:hypothetical protein
MLAADFFEMPLLENCLASGGVWKKRVILIWFPFDQKDKESALELFCSSLPNINFETTMSAPPYVLNFGAGPAKM